MKSFASFDRKAVEKNQVQIDPITRDAPISLPEKSQLSFRKNRPTYPFHLARHHGHLPLIKRPLIIRKIGSELNLVDPRMSPRRRVIHKLQRRIQKRGVHLIRVSTVLKKVLRRKLQYSRKLLLRLIKTHSNIIDIHRRVLQINIFFFESVANRQNLLVRQKNILDVIDDAQEREQPRDHRLFEGSLALDVVIIRKQLGLLGGYFRWKLLEKLQAQVVQVDHRGRGNRVVVREAAAVSKPTWGACVRWPSKTRF